MIDKFVIENPAVLFRDLRALKLFIELCNNIMKLVVLIFSEASQTWGSLADGLSQRSLPLVSTLL
jgi:hypothetical protein